MAPAVSPPGPSWMQKTVEDRELRPVDFLEASSLAAQSAQVEELGAADLGGTDLFDPVDDLGVEGEDTLDALAEADLSDGEAALGSALERNHDALKSLDTFLIALFDLDLDANGVAGHEIGVVRAVQFIGEALHYGMNRHSSFLTVLVEIQTCVQTLILH